MSFTTCTSLSQLEKVHTIAGTIVKGPGHRSNTTTLYVRWMHYCNTVQEHSPVVCFTESSGERGRRLSGWRAELSDNAATDGGRWRSARPDDAGRGEWRRVSGRVQLLVVGETRSADTTMWWQRSDWSAVLRCQTVL